MLFANPASLRIPAADSALPGRDEPMPVPRRHFVHGRPIVPPFPGDTEQVLIGMGCFWGAEKAFWNVEGVYTTAVGYAGGLTKNPTYREVCSGGTGHAEVVLVVYEPQVLPFERLLSILWEHHDPTQGMRQGNDVGTQYRSTIYVTGAERLQAAAATRDRYAPLLGEAGHGPITTEIRGAPPFYYAEEYHQQYLAKNPFGYCGLSGTGVACPAGVVKETPAR